ncbi:MAG: PHP domain-containing protein [Pseudomonadales bacterium]|nr:PHP domain-containing protein [Pseudomonadales bacterium]
MMINEYDLHAHTTCSDGTLTPEELVSLAHEVGVSHLAITDHDSVEGIVLAKKCAKVVGLGLISGVEISSRWSNMDIHIVGLQVNEADEQLLQRLQSQHQQRFQRAEKICRKLQQKAGCEDLYPTLLERTAGKPPGRPDIAKLLIEIGKCKTMNEAFRKYLAMGKQAYISTEWPEIEESIQWIHDAGGMAVLAHPSRYKLTRTKLSRLIACFKAAGGQAIEVSTTGQDPTKTAQLAKFAEEYGLLASTGSDFHSPAMPWVQLGKAPPLPKLCTPVWTAF